MFFSVQFTVILVNAKVYLAKFQKKIAICESFFLKFCVFAFVCSRQFQPRKGSTLKTLHFHSQDMGRKLDVHKTFRRRPGRVLNVLCTFNIRPVSRG